MKLLAITQDKIERRKIPEPLARSVKTDFSDILLFHETKDTPIIIKMIQKYSMRLIDSPITNTPIIVLINTREEFTTAATEVSPISRPKLNNAKPMNTKNPAITKISRLSSVIF